jgi:hypothetical protein
MEILFTGSKGSARGLGGNWGHHLEGQFCEPIDRQSYLYAPALLGRFWSGSTAA